MKNLFLLLLFVSCMPKRSALVFEVNEPELRNIEVPMSEVSKTENMTFEKLKERILEPKCFSCHSQMEDETYLKENYISGNDPDESPLFNAVKSGLMPFGGTPLDSEELEFVRSYIVSIKIEHTEDRSSPAETFTQLSENVLQPKCMKCHGNLANEKNVLKWVNQTDPLNSKLLKRTKDGTMPKGGKKLSQNEFILIETYLKTFIN